MRDEGIFQKASDIAIPKVMEIIKRVRAKVLDYYVERGNLRRLAGKSYQDLTPEERMGLRSIFHQDNELFQCPYCRWENEALKKEK